VESLGAPQPIEHGTSKGGRWLRARRLRIAAWIAVGEGLLVVLHVIPYWPAILLAILVVAAYAFIGRNVKNDTIRQASWVAAASQALMILVPIVVAFVGFLAIIVLALVAVVALVVLFTDRD
jgi:hypothetical protein